MCALTIPTFGHRDTFGPLIDDCLENKQTISLRDDDAWTHGPRIDELDLDGPLPPGALGYVRTRAATICRAGRDIEFHQLAHAVHVSGDTAAWLRHLCMPSVPVVSPTRGVWGADGWFHPWGVALCDSWREKTRREQREWEAARQELAGAAAERRALPVLSDAVVVYLSICLMIYCTLIRLLIVLWFRILNSGCARDRGMFPFDFISTKLFINRSKHTFSRV